MNLLYLVRHAENVANVTLEFSSLKVDYSLTEKGILQARQTGSYFQGKGIDEIYCSPLKRARETGEIIAEMLGLKAVVMENFREIQVGDLEGLPVSKELWDIHDRIFIDWIYHKPASKFPHGDDYHSLWGRMRTGVEQILTGKSGKKIMIVGHGGMFTATLQDLCPGTDRETLLKSFTGNCSITEIEMEPLDGTPRGRLIAWASCAHLSGWAANLVPGMPEDGTYLQNGASKP